MLDELQKHAKSVISQARPAGMGTRGYASSAGGSARAGSSPEPGYAVGDGGLGLRYFIPGRDPLYDSENPPPYEYILGRST